MDCELREKIISKLISTNANSEALKDFKDAFSEFRKFMKKVIVKDEGGVVLKLKKVESDLTLISAFPDLFKKNIITIGGGFSAGKSEFINSFTNIKLPVNIDPTTAIATYVLKGNDEIIACSYKGAKVDLKEIDKNFLQILSHQFIKSFKFNIKELLEYLVVATKMSYENICFVDTPGYNPSKKEEDFETASKYLKNSEVLIWLIGLDSSGTIPSSDLNFLEKLGLENKKLYVVLNKADLKGISDLEDIIDEIKDVLEDYSIEYEGISAYSAIFKEEFLFEKKSLFKFLEEENSEKLIVKDIINEFQKIYLLYKLSLEREKKEKKVIYNTLHSLSMDLLEEDLDSENAFLRVEDLKSYFKFRKEKLFEVLDEIFFKFEKSLISLFGINASLNLDFYIENIDLTEDIYTQIDNILNKKVDDDIEFDFD